MFKKFFLVGVGVFLNWTALGVILIINVIRVALSNPALVAWWVLAVWLVANLVVAKLIFTYLRRNSGRIVAKTVKAGIGIFEQADSFLAEMNKSEEEEE